MQSNAQMRPLTGETCSEYAGSLLGQFMGTAILKPRLMNDKTGTFERLKIENVTDSTGSLRRAPAAGYERSQSSFEETNYTTVEYGLEEALDDSEVARYAKALDAEREAANIMVFRLMRALENRIATKVFNATTFSGYTGAVGTEWSTASTATPYQNVQDAILTLKRQVGGALGDVDINLAMSEKVFRNVVKTTEIQGKIMGGAGSSLDERSGYDMIGAARLANILGVNNVFYSAAQVKNAAGTLADIWDDEYALLYINPRGDSLKELQVGRCFMWNEAGNPYTVETYRDEPTRSDILRVRHHTDENVFAPMAGYLFSNVTT